MAPLRSRDSDLDVDFNDYNSTRAHVLKIGGREVSYCSRKQSIVATPIRNGEHTSLGAAV